MQKFEIKYTYKYPSHYYNGVITGYSRKRKKIQVLCTEKYLLKYVPMLKKNLENELKDKYGEKINFDIDFYIVPTNLIPKNLIPKKSLNYYLGNNNEMIDFYK